jgi:hypothetical protein
MHLDGLFFILLVGAAAVLRWLSQRGNQNNSANEQTPDAPPRNAPPVRRGAPGSEEERVRRFLEALGQPTSSSPPPKVQPRPVTVATTTEEARDRAEKARRALRKPVWTNPLPPLTTAPPPAEAAAPPPPVIIPPVVVPPPRRRARASRAEAPSRASTTEATQPDGSKPFADLFTSTARLRDAIVLREIFGPPRGLLAPETF